MESEIVCPLVPVSVSLLIVFFHVLGEKFSERIERYHFNFLSLAAGLLVGALFLELIPRISVGETFFGGHIYLIFLVGFVTVHILEKLLYQRGSDDSDFESLKTRFEVGGLLAYQLLVGLVNVVFFETYGNLAYFVLIPFFVRAFSFSSKHIIEKTNKNINRFLISSGPIMGTISGLLFVKNSFQVYLVLAITSGAILYITVRDVIPVGRKGKPAYFLVGIMIATATFIIFGTA